MDALPDGRFLDQSRLRPLYALFHPTVHAELRRGETRGLLRRADVDLDARTGTTAHRIVQLGLAAEAKDTRTDSSQRTIALAVGTYTGVPSDAARTAAESAAALVPRAPATGSGDSWWRTHPEHNTKPQRHTGEQRVNRGFSATWGRPGGTRTRDPGIMSPLL
ncbi:hypothetical protein ABH917_002718 [Thermobifida halotolerans]